MCRQDRTTSTDETSLANITGDSTAGRQDRTSSTDETFPGNIVVGYTRPRSQVLNNEKGPLAWLLLTAGSGCKTDYMH